MVRYKALWGLFFAVLTWPLPAATVNFLVVEEVRESSGGEGSAPVPPVSFESSALWETCLLDVFFEAGHVVSNSPILRLSGAADSPGGDESGGEFPPALRSGLEEAILGGAGYLILVRLSYPPGTDPKTKPEEVRLGIYSLKPAGGGNLTGFVYEDGASLVLREDRPAGEEIERDRAKRLIRALIPHIKD
jgi:hypothetical protein